MNTLGNSLSMLKNPAILSFILQGVLFTLIISVVAVFFSILFGTVLALLRNYCTTSKTRGFKAISVIYIELFRNTPLLFWIFICLVFCPTPGFVDQPMFGLSSVNNKLLFKAAVALVLYTSGVIAEIVRGGLNSVAHGQIEAGQSQGFSMVQIMWYIVLPQAFKAIIPTLLSQVITTIKDSSFLANVAVIELMARTKQILSAANRYNGTNSINVSDVFVLFGTAAMIYFVINFSLSMVVRSMQNRRLASEEKRKVAIMPRQIKEVDKARESYRKKYCKNVRDSFDNRDICIDSSRFGAEKTAYILCDIARGVFVK